MTALSRFSALLRSVTCLPHHSCYWRWRRPHGMPSPPPSSLPLAPYHSWRRNFSRFLHVCSRENFDACWRTVAMWRFVVQVVKGVHEIACRFGRYRASLSACVRPCGLGESSRGLARMYRVRHAGGAAPSTSGWPRRWHARYERMPGMARVARLSCLLRSASGGSRGSRRFLSGVAPLALRASRLLARLAHVACVSAHTHRRTHAASSPAS